MSDFFYKDMIKLIQQMEKGENNREDRIELIYTNYGKTISALCTEANNSNLISNFSKHTWLKKLKLNQRAYLFWWRVLNYALPTNDWLCHRRLASNSVCPRGCQDIEDIEHVTTQCSKLTEIIQKLKLWGFSVPSFQNLNDCINELKHKADNGLAKISAMTVYFSWRSRNLVNHGISELPIAYTAVEIISHVSYLQSNPIEKNWNTNQLLLSKSWCPPPEGWIKLNVDVTLSKSNMAGIAGLLRDRKVRMICAYGRNLFHRDIAYLELKAILTFENYIQDWFCEYKGIIIEGDNVNIIKMLQESINMKTNKGMKPDLSFLQVFNNIIFLFTPRECNKTADYCANLALLGDFFFGTLLLKQNFQQVFYTCLGRAVIEFSFSSLCNFFHFL
ncbi:hypothetical protein KFK09_022777 [Dendrobium nobile]|uniref:RNase H type-1 domain-containing protein n=1 Tax=Dendrobium nobile TaxID=94219 RepID=A0A8T3AK23_DENNO|nr:hypothetical protein KFK09_022777 [Dendrobium nobile]